jgi:tetratricopeptide (TPR) repeat protein
VNLNVVRGFPPLEISSYLEEIKETKSSAVLSEKLGDLYAAQGKPSSAAQLYEQALKLAPSPQQRIRLRLALAEKLAALGRDEDAIMNYRKFIEENINYPDKVPIYRKLAALAQKLGKKDEAAKFEDLVRMLTPTVGK